MAVLLRCLLVVAALDGCLAAPALAQRAADVGRVPTVTRLVKVFSELETTLNERIGAKDARAVDALLDADFEARDSDEPGTPVPRADWIAAALAAQPSAGRIEQMAVHDFRTIAVVSFRQVGASERSRANAERFIVDCWRRVDDHWMLAVRYVGTSIKSPLPTAKRRQPIGKH